MKPEFAQLVAERKNEVSETDNAESKCLYVLTKDTIQLLQAVCVCVYTCHAQTLTDAATGKRCVT